MVRDLTVGKSGRVIFSFCLPLFLSVVFQQLYTIADSFVAGRFIGEEALAAVGNSYEMTLIFIAFAFGCSMGASVLVSKLFGAKDYKKLKSSVSTSIIATAVCFSFLMVFGLLVGKRILLLINTPSSLMDPSWVYLEIYLFGLPFLFLYNLSTGIFSGLGDSRTPFIFLALSSTANIFIDIYFVAGLKMGVDGVAWPSVLSRVVAAMLILGRCYRQGQTLTVPRTLRLEGTMARRILGIGIPSAFENSLFQSGRILVVSMISTFGTVQIAANAVANNLDGMGCIPGQAISLAMITVVGHCIGAGDDQQAIHFTRKLLLWAYIAMGISNGLILLFLRPLVGIYELSGETMALAILLVRIHAGSGLFLWPASFVLPNALRAANDVKFTMVVAILSMAAWRLGFSYLLCVLLGWGAVGVWIAMVIDWICRVICFVTRFRSGAWKSKYHA